MGMVTVQLQVGRVTDLASSGVCMQCKSDILGRGIARDFVSLSGFLFGEVEPMTSTRSCSAAQSCTAKALTVYSIRIQSVP